MFATRERVIPRIDQTGRRLLGLALAFFVIALLLMTGKAHAQSSPAVEFALPHDLGQIAIKLDENARVAALAAKEALERDDVANFCINADTAEDLELAISVIAVYTFTFKEREETDPPYITELRGDFAQKCNH